MMKAPVGSSLAVTGSSSAMVSAGPMPGRMPISVPSVTPTSDHNRLIGVSAVAKPSMREVEGVHRQSSPAKRPAGNCRPRQSRETDIGDDARRRAR